MIEILLGNIKYDFEKWNPETNEAPISEVVVWEIREDENDSKETSNSSNKNYLQGAVVVEGLGIFQKGETSRVVKIPTHLNIPVRNINDDQWMYEGADIVIRAQKEDEITRVEVVTSKVEQEYQQYSQSDYLDNNYVYFVPPRFWIKRGDQIESINFSNHYTAAGTETIVITYKDKPKDSFRLQSIPPVERDDYDEIVSDLYDMSDRLIASDNGTSISGQSVVEKLSDYVNELEKALKRIEKNLDKELVQGYEKLPEQKVKYFSNKTVTQLEADMPKVNTIVYKENINTYENGQIKKFFVNLLESINRKINNNKWRIFNEERQINEHEKQLREAISQKYPQADINRIIDPNSDMYRKKQGLDEECMDEIKQLINEEKSHEKAKKEIEDDNKKLEELSKRIDRLLKKSILREIHKSEKPLKKTNIFAGNKYYKEFYKLMTSDMPLGVYVNPYYEKGKYHNLSIEKLEVLYERWCLIKFLFIFVKEYHFYFCDKSNDKLRPYTDKESIDRLRFYIDELLSKGNLTGAKFVLERDLENLEIKGKDELDSLWQNRTDSLWQNRTKSFGLSEKTKKFSVEDWATRLIRKFQIKMYYNREFEFEDFENNIANIKERLPMIYDEKKAEKLVRSRRPDFYLEMSIINNEGTVEMRKNFCFDAKYRSKNTVAGGNGRSRWFSDLFGVALQKYIIELNALTSMSEKPEDKITGSYILHSNKDCYMKEVNPKGYYGAYKSLTGSRMINAASEEYAKPWMEERKRRELSNEIVDLFYKFDEVKDKFDWEIGELKKELSNIVGENRIGSVLMLPGNMDYFKTLITMIMEHHFGVFNWICWNCGKDVDPNKIEAIHNDDWEEGDRIKFSYVCPACGEFQGRNYCSIREDGELVRIGKHRIPYYSYNGNKWNLYCPKCHQSY